MKMINVVMILGAMGLGLLFLSLPKKDVIKDSSVLIVGTSPDYFPYEFIDKETSEIVGFDIDVVTEIAMRLNKKIIIKPMSFVSLIFGLLSGDIDMIASAMSPTPRRSKLVLFTEKYFDNDPHVIVTLKNRFEPNSLQDLSGKDVVVNTGYTAEAYLDQQDINMHLIRLSTPALALIALQSGSADAFVCALSTARSMIEKIANPDNFALFVLPNTDDEYVFALSRGAVDLAGQINAALSSMRIDGTLDRLKEKWKLS